jgi:hypothetical protein
VGLPGSLIREIRRLDEGQLRQVLILVRGLLVTSEQPVVDVSDIPGMPTVRYRQRSVSCGKASCTACPHGPYWYAHWTEDGRRRSRYIGGELPAEVARKLEELDAVRRHAADDPAADDPAADDPADEVAITASGDGPGPTRRGLRLVGGNRN